MHARDLNKQERKMSANLKWFTSQITNELPGPKIPTTNTSLYALARLDEKIASEQQKHQQMKIDAKKVVKNQVFYGSLYQQLD